MSAADELGARAIARVAALSILCGAEASGDSAERASRRFWSELAREAGIEPEPGTIPYSDRLVAGVLEHRDAIDARVSQASTNWRLDRMGRVERNVLRLGAYELAHVPEVPRAVVLDQAVELAKRYGSGEAGAFVNGVLDRIATDLGRVDRDRS